MIFAGRGDTTGGTQPKGMGKMHPFARIITGNYICIMQQRELIISNYIKAYNNFDVRHA